MSDVAQPVGVVAEAVAQAVDQGAERVDGEPGLVEVGLGDRAVGVRHLHQVHHRQLLEPERVVGDQVDGGDRGDLGLEPEELLELLLADLGDAPGSAGDPAPGSSSGRCSPDGVQRLLTRVSWQEIRS